MLHQFGGVARRLDELDATHDRGASRSHVPLGSGFGFRYHVLQSENRDARFLRNEAALEYELSATSAVFAQTSLLADKSLVDVSVAGHVRDEFRDGIVDRDEGFQGKATWNTRSDFSPSATLVAIVSMQLDDFEFGGGGVQFVARF